MHYPVLINHEKEICHSSLPFHRIRNGSSNKNTHIMKIILLFASIVMASGVLMSNIYTSVVDATSWGSDIPHSIESAREYFKAVNPANFFRIYSPVNQVL